MIRFYVIAHYDYLLKGIIDSFYNHSHSRKVTLVSTFGNAMIRFLSEKKDFYSRKVSLMTKIENKNYLLCGFTFRKCISSNPQLSPSTSFLRVHVLSLLNYQIN